MNYFKDNLGMTYLIRESNKNDSNSIRNFNKELEENGFNFRLPVTFSKDLNADDFLFTRKFILIENKISVRAGYTLKSQWFKINNDLLKVGYYYNPITAGLFNKKYNICGVMLLHDAQKKNPNLFCLGMGGYSETLPKLLKGLNWNLQKIPFFFRVHNPYIFLKNIRFFKNTKFKFFFINFLANTGLGWLCIKLLFFLTTLFHIRLKKKSNVVMKELEVFDQSLDTLWDIAKQHSEFIAVRNAKYLKILYSDKRFIKMKFFDQDQIIGWSVSLCTQLNDHKQFGNMKLGSIVDCLSLRGYESNIIKETSNMLKNKGADLIVSNQSHTFWMQAFKKNSFVGGPSNFIFASSVTLSKKLKNNKKFKDYMHLTRGDGDGPINL